MIVIRLVLAPVIETHASALLPVSSRRAPTPPAEPRRYPSFNHPRNPSYTMSTTTAAAAASKPLTLIVAATPSLGIGKAGGMPWRLRTELAYFARVTKRAPAGALNAVVMGRKTWFSIPARFRPLPDRINVVLSRDANLDLQTDAPGVIRASSIADALEKLEGRADVGRIFVIGGAEIYKAAMEHPGKKNVLLTRIENEFEVDTFFPWDRTGWKKVDGEALDKFTGEEVPKGMQTEGNVKFEYELWEKEA